MEHPVAADVAVGHVFEHGEGLGEFLVSRGPVAEEIAVGRIDVRLVDGDPVADEIAEAVGAELGKGEEIVEIFAFENAPMRSNHMGLEKWWIVSSGRMPSWRRYSSSAR